MKKRESLRVGHWAPLAAIIGLASVTSLGINAQFADASWTDSVGGASEFNAMTVPSITGYSCVNGSTIGLLKTATLSWQSPKTEPTSQYKIVLTNNAGQTTTSFQTAPSLRLNDTFLGSALGGLVNDRDTLRITVATTLVEASSWESPPSAVIRVDYTPAILLLGGFTCVTP